MSLYSTFYSGDPDVIERAAKQEKLGALEEPGVQVIDFSGGIMNPFLFPDDFMTLTKGGRASFWQLEGTNLLASGEENGFYRMPEADIERLRNLGVEDMREFSRNWNTERQRRAAESKPRSVWRSPRFLKVVAGGVLGLLIVIIKERGDRVASLILITGMLGAAGFAFWYDRSARRRWERRSPAPEVDWVRPLQDLQRFLTQAREKKQPVYYYWSL